MFTQVDSKLCYAEISREFVINLYIISFALTWNGDSRRSFLSHFTLLLQKR